MKKKITALTIVLMTLISIGANAQTIRGDVNGDNQVTESDITSIVNVILGRSDISEDRADVNKDRVVNVADVCTEINIIAEWKKTAQTLTGGSTEEVADMLKTLSGTDNSDAQTVATVLQDNPNVEEAITTDGSNLVVKLKESESHIVYPLYEVADIISQYDASSDDIQTASVRNMARHQANFYNGTIAIFNHFSGIPGYRLQNRIISNIKVMFETNGYDVAYFGTNPSNEYNGNIDYEQYFDHEHLNDVIKHSDEYDAILIFSHGYEYNGKSYFATGEKVKTTPDEGWYIYEKEDGEYYYNYPVEALKTDNKCIVYLGSCFGVPASGLNGKSFITEKNSCFIGWNGKNRIAQVDAMTLFNSMIIHGLTLDEAIKHSFSKDPWNESVQRFEYNTANHSLEGASIHDYVEGKSLTIKTTKAIYRKEDDKTYIELRVKPHGDWNFMDPIRIRIESMLYGNTKPSYRQFIGFCGKEKEEQIGHLILDNNTEEDIYQIYVQTPVNQKWERVQMSYPNYILYSCSLSDNYSEPVPPESETRTPIVLDSNGQLVDEINLVAGASKSFSIDAYNGHELDALCGNKSVCTVTLSGSTLIVTGVSEGTAYIGVYDKDNHKMAIAKVTVDPRSTASKIDLVNNGDMEGNDVSNFFAKLGAGDINSAGITDGVGVNGSRGIKVEATERMSEIWDNQFWIRLDQPISAGTKYRFSFDYRADKDAQVHTESHLEPGDYNSGNNSYFFTSDWNSFSKDGYVYPDESTDEKPFRSIAFDLSTIENANNYYFDNIKFEVYLENQCPKPTFLLENKALIIGSPFDATIYYTLDGTTPTMNSPVYTSPLTFNEDCMVKVIAVVDGYDISPVAIYNYVVQTEGTSDKNLMLITEVDGTIYRVYRQILDKNDVHTNPDNWQTYKSKLTLDIKKNGSTTTYLIDDDIYLEEKLAYNRAQYPCLLLDFQNKQISIFCNSKDGNANVYSMDGYFYTSPMNNISFQRETVFSEANWGWFPYFTYDKSNDELKLHHFSYSGYYDMTSTHIGGSWSSTKVSHIDPDNYKQQSALVGNVLVIR